jgi:glycosyltransferase involved in cell wall biosynthesis
MKASIFFDGYKPLHELKDPGQIILGLQEKGVQAKLLTEQKSELSDYCPEFPVVKSNFDDLASESFWANEDSDVILAYTWLFSSYNAIVERMKFAGKKVIIKSDSDGRIGYPVPTSFLRAPVLEEPSFRSIARHIWWRLPSKSLHSRKALPRIRQIELSEAVIIESPDALSNLNFFLTAWGRTDLIKKIHFVPNPVTPEFTNSRVGSKENVIVSIGRWEIQAKNAVNMIEAMKRFLKARPDYKWIVVGSGEERLRQLVSRTSQEIRDRILVTGQVEHDKIKGFLLKAKMLFAPSRWESFSIAACEAVCSGCSVVGTPVESLKYLTMQGFSGTIASTFENDALLAALFQDSSKWEHNYYVPEEIAAFWRSKVNRGNVAEDIIRIVSTL